MSVMKDAQASRQLFEDCFHEWMEQNGCYIGDEQFQRRHGETSDQFRDRMVRLRQLDVKVDLNHMKAAIYILLREARDGQS